MNKKKILTLLVTTTLLAVVGVGSTLAYFTDKTETLQNVVTMGKVDARLAENGTKRESGVWSFTSEIIPSGCKDKGSYKDVIPGDTVKKNPTVYLVPGSADAWVRVKFDINGGKWLETKVKNDNKLVEENNLLKPPSNKTFKQLIEEEIKDKILESGDWLYDGDEYYYFRYKLKAPAKLEGNFLSTLNGIGTDTTPATKAMLFDEFVFPFKIDNNAANNTFNIDINAELIQADHTKMKIYKEHGKDKVKWVSESDENVELNEIQPYPLKGSSTPVWP